MPAHGWKKKQDDIDNLPRGEEPVILRTGEKVIIKYPEYYHGDTFNEEVEYTVIKPYPHGYLFYNPKKGYRFYNHWEIKKYMRLG